MWEELGSLLPFLVVPFGAMLRGMAKHSETVMVRDAGISRAVKVMIEAPHPEELDIQYLAQEAWLRPSKKLIRGNVTVWVYRI